MAADDDRDDKPSLEPPSLFGRRRKASAAASDAAVPPVAPPPTPPPADDGSVSDGPDGAVDDAAGDTRVFTDAGVGFADAGRDAPGPVADEGPGQGVGQPATGAVPAAPASAPRRAGRAPRLPALPALPRRGRPATSATSTGAGTAPRPARRTAPGLPAVPRYLLAPAVGLVCGLALLGLVQVVLTGCEAVRGGSSCGTGPGLVGLIVVFALTVALGRVLLGLLRAPEPGMTSFLAVGLTCLVAVLVLSGLFDSGAIVVVLPLLCAAAFAASAWIATLQVDLDD